MATTTIFTAVKDSFINSVTTTTNYGATDPIILGYIAKAGDSRLLFEFDLTALPVDTLVSAASLILNCTSAALSADACTAYRQSYTFNHVEAEETWLIWKTGGNWPAPGAEGNYTTPSVAFLLPLTTGSKTYTGFETIVQDAITNRSRTLELLIRKDTEAAGGSCTYDSKEDATAGNRPQLSVTYVTRRRTGCCV